MCSERAAEALEALLEECAPEVVWPEIGSLVEFTIKVGGPDAKGAWQEQERYVVAVRRDR